jgi:hypothetical protein
MKKSAYSVAAVVTSVALLAAGAPASQAFTAKELSICWVNQTPNTVWDLEVVADGPAYRTATLDNGDCAAWDVRPGQYKFTFEDIEEFAASVEDACDELDAPADYVYTPDLTIAIKRQGEAYRASNYATIANGGVRTDVKKDRRTSATVL